MYSAEREEEGEEGREKATRRREKPRNRVKSRGTSFSAGGGERSCERERETNQLNQVSSAVLNLFCSAAANTK